MKRLIQFIRDEEGASAVEYGFLIAGIALVVALSITVLGQVVNNLYDQATRLF
jgi:pilus assembly protein Flp/PilA